MSETHAPATDERAVKMAFDAIVERDERYLREVAKNTGAYAVWLKVDHDRATIAALRETNARLNRRVTKAEGVVLSKARDESAAGRSLGRALANAACSALRAQNVELLAACEDLSERLTYVLEADEHGPDLCDADEGFQTRRCENDGCLLHAVKNAAFAIQKAKENHDTDR